MLPLSGRMLWASEHGGSDLILEGGVEAHAALAAVTGVEREGFSRSDGGESLRTVLSVNLGALPALSERTPPSVASSYILASSGEVLDDKMYGDQETAPTAAAPTAAPGTREQRAVWNFS